MSKLKNEPAVVTSVLVALIGAAATLGLIGTDTQDQLVAVITAVVPIIGGLIVRANVTPTRKLAPEPPAQEDLAAEVPDTAPAPEPAPVASTDPVKASMKAAIETVRAQSNAQNDARAAAATAAVDASA